MKTRLFAVLLIAVVFSSIQACGGDDDDGEDNNGGGSFTISLKEFCTETGEELCKSAENCGGGISSSVCLDAYMQGCCENANRCDQNGRMESKSAYERCKSDLGNLTCSDILNIDLPSSCNL